MTVVGIRVYDQHMYEVRRILLLGIFNYFAGLKISLLGLDISMVLPGTRKQIVEIQGIYSFVLLV